MGRRMRALDPEAGVAERFACELRALRAAAGEPPFWKMARRCGASKSALAGAVDGRTVPSENVVREFVRVCGGDWEWWRERLRQARSQLDGPAAPGERPPLDGERTGSSSTAVTLQPWLPVPLAGRQLGAVHGVTAPELPGRAGLPEAGPGPSARRRPWILLVIALVEAVAIVALVARGLASASTGSVPVEDGMDPKSSHCDTDARTLDTASVVLRAASSVAGRELAAGTPVGIVSLRYSDRCHGAWARFDPAPEVFSGPDQGTVTILATRPAEGAETSFRLGHIDETYSDLLLTGVGCVVAAATVNIGQAAATGTTRCLPSM
jgi:hypothetical protein